MGETLPEGISRQEFGELQTLVKELRDALDAQTKARSESEQREAKEDVREAKADLDQLAKELGISPKSLKDAAAQAQRNERKEELRPLLLELLDEELADDEEGQKPADEQKPQNGKTDEVKEEGHGSEDDTPPAPEDTAPRKEHWSDKAVSGLFG